MLGKQRVDWRQAWLALAVDGKCPECHRGIEGHEAINVNGQPFARCLSLTARSQGEVFERQFRLGREGRQS
jgi:hypothetical protein